MVSSDSIPSPDMTPMTPSPRPPRSPLTTQVSSGILDSVYTCQEQDEKVGQESRVKETGVGVSLGRSSQADSKDCRSTRRPSSRTRKQKLTLLVPEAGVEVEDRELGERPGAVVAARHAGEQGQSRSSSSVSSSRLSARRRARRLARGMERRGGGRNEEAGDETAASEHCSR